MSEWQGFDRRKVCPQCGGYQTGFGKRERTTDSQQGTLALSLVALLALPLLAIFGVLMMRGAVPDPGLIFGLFLTILLGLGVLLFNRDIRRGLKASDRDNKSSTVYRLSCDDCGHIWEMTEEEWEATAQQEREELTRSPAFLPQNRDNTVKSFEEIDRKQLIPRGILIVVGAVLLILAAGVSAIGTLWLLSHPGHLYTPIVSVMVIVIGLSIYAMLAVILKFRAVKIVPVAILGLITIVLWFLLK